MASSQESGGALPPGIAGPGALVGGKLRIERLLGVGGMGAVLAARHLHLDRLVAVKFLLPGLARDPQIVARFLREARAASRIRGEHIARVLDVGTLDDGTPYIVMDLLDGEDVDRLLARQGKLPIAQAVDIVLEACVALAEAHAEGVVHRDLKPSNLFVTAAGVKVLDFGISKLRGEEVDGSLTRTSSMIGSPLYMSPEQLRAAKDVDARTDIWALGVIAYELLAGARPFEGATIAEIGAAVFTKTPVPLRTLRPEVPAELAFVIDTCLEKEREQRFASVAELAFQIAPFGTQRAARALERVASFASRLPPPARAPRASAVKTHDGLTAAARAPREPAGRAVAIAAVAIALVAATAIAGVYAVRKRVRAVTT
ncbi:MAG TPA: serine/threonine-protein kinase, partial [Labilithrix sp.]